MGRTGRRSAAYKAAAAEYRAGRYPCWICHERPGTTVDHDPPLSTAAHPALWTGRLRPACPTCQGRQGQRLTTSLRYGPRTSRRW